MEQLFKKIKEIEQTQMAEREAARERGEHFNIFAVCGVNHYEVKHSLIIAELLNPQGSHGQGSLFLDAFLSSFYSDFNFRSEGVSVVTEYDIHNGRIDILIRNSIGQAIIIENKIYAQDQYEQLKRYNHYAHNHFGDGQYEILYLTLYGEEPSKASTGDKYIPYRTISYATTIVEWLEDCIKLTARLPIIRETLIQYQNHIHLLYAILNFVKILPLQHILHLLLPFVQMFFVIQHFLVLFYCFQLSSFHLYMLLLFLLYLLYDLLFPRFLLS